MSRGTRYTDESSAWAARQIIDGGHKVAKAAERPGVTTWSLMRWKKRFGYLSGQAAVAAAEPPAADLAAENARL